MPPKGKKAGKGGKKELAKRGAKQPEKKEAPKPVESTRSTRGSSRAPPQEEKVAPKRKASPSPAPKKGTPAKKTRSASPSPAPTARQSRSGRATSASAAKVEVKQSRSASQKKVEDKPTRVTRAVLEDVESKKAASKPENKSRSSSRTKTPVKAAATPKQKEATPKQKEAAPPKQTPRGRSSTPRAPATPKQKEAPRGRSATPKAKQPPPKPKQQTPKEKAVAAKSKSVTPKPATPKQKAATPKQKAVTPKEKSTPKPKTPTPKQKTPTPKKTPPSKKVTPTKTTPSKTARASPRKSATPSKTGDESEDTISKEPEVSGKEETEKIAEDTEIEKEQEVTEAAKTEPMKDSEEAMEDEEDEIEDIEDEKDTSKDEAMEVDRETDDKTEKPPGGITTEEESIENNDADEEMEQETETDELKEAEAEKKDAEELVNEEKLESEEVIKETVEEEIAEPEKEIPEKGESEDETTKESGEVIEEPEDQNEIEEEEEEGEEQEAEKEEKEEELKEAEEEEPEVEETTEEAEAVTEELGKEPAIADQQVEVTEEPPEVEEVTEEQEEEVVEELEDEEAEEEEPEVEASAEEEKDEEPEKEPQDEDAEEAQIEKDVIIPEKDDLEKASVVAQADETEQMEELVAGLGDTESDMGADNSSVQESLDENGGGDTGEGSKSETVEEVQFETSVQEVQQTSYPVVEVPDGYAEESEVNTTGIEIAQEVSEVVAVSEDIVTNEAELNDIEDVTPIQIDEASSSLSNGEQSSSLSSPKKRKHDEVDEEEEFKHMKKARLSEEFVQGPYTNGDGSAESEDITKEYVVIDMADVPPSESQEVTDSVPKETVQNFTNEGVIHEQETVDQNHANITQTVSETNPVYNRVFIPNPHFSGATDTSKQFSVVSYNVLADCHLFRNDYSFTESDYLEPDYRLNKLVEEIQYLDGDVVCLQEVDPDFFHDQLLPSMKSFGYEGFHKKRTEEFFDEGEATFFKTDRFELVDVSTYRVADLIEREFVEGMDPSIQAAVRKYMDRSDVLVVTKLQCKSTGQQVTVGNIHVTWGEMKVPDVQSLQIACAIKEVVMKAGSEACPHIMCGDFNSEPLSAGYHMAKDGYLSDEGTITQLQKLTNLELPEGQSDSLVNCLWSAFQHTSSSLKSAYMETQGAEPDITSYNRVMCACVDYLFYSSSSLDNVGILQTASKDKIMETGGTPNCYFPSDHVSMKAVFSFR